MKEEIIKSLNARYSTKLFDKTKKISKETWEVMEEALLLTPSSFGMEPWKFYVITNDEVKSKLRPFSWNQSQIEDCSHLVVFASRKQIDNTYINSVVERIAEVRGVPLSSLEGYAKMMIESMAKNPNHLGYSSNQTFIALGNILTVASLLKIDACPIGGFEPEKYDEILQIPADYTSVVVCPFGYKSSEDKYASLKKVRRRKEEMIIRI
jgi:nitroreductase